MGVIRCVRMADMPSQMFTWRATWRAIKSVLSKFAKRTTFKCPQFSLSKRAEICDVRDMREHYRDFLRNQ